MAMTVARVDRFLEGPLTLCGIFSLTFSGSYQATGEPADLLPLMGWGNEQPYDVQFFQEGSAGWKLSWNRTTKRVQVFIEQTTGTNLPLAEHTVAAYGAGLTGDTNIRLIARFKKG
jgi:hypothetical protein